MSSLHKALVATLSPLFSFVLVMVPICGGLPPADAAQGNVALPTVTDVSVGNKVFQISHIVVKARPEVVWHILSDYNNATAVFENLKKCEVLEDHGTTKIVRHIIHPSNFPGTFEYVIEVKETPMKGMEWHRIRGSFKEVDGSWKLEPVDGGKYTQVTYLSHVNGGLFLPSPLVRNQVKGDMPEILLALKNRVEASSVQIARRPDLRQEHSD